MVEYLFSLSVVIDSAENVTATIPDGLLYVTQPEFEDRMDSLFGGNKSPVEFWTRTDGDDRKLRPSGLVDVRMALMGVKDMRLSREGYLELSNASIQNALNYANGQQHDREALIKEREERITVIKEAKDEWKSALKAEETARGNADNEIKNLISNKTHDSLQGLQGGTTGQYYHLTAAQVSKVDNAAAASDIIKDHENLTGLQGGTTGQHYHLTAAEKSKLTALPEAGNIPSPSDIVKSHNSLTGLQGGDSTGYYHLTLSEFNSVRTLIGYTADIKKLIDNAGSGTGGGSGSGSGSGTETPKDFGLLPGTDKGIYDRIEFTALTRDNQNNILLGDIKITSVTVDTHTVYYPIAQLFKSDGTRITCTNSIARNYRLSAVKGDGTVITTFDIQNELSNKYNPVSFRIPSINATNGVDDYLQIQHKAYPGLVARIPIKYKLHYAGTVATPTFTSTGATLYYQSWTDLVEKLAPQL